MSTSKMTATDSVEFVDWPTVILDSRCRWTLGESLTHFQSDDRRSLNLDIRIWRIRFQQNVPIMSPRLGGSSSAL